MRWLRPIPLVMLLTALCWFEFAQPLTAAELAQQTRDRFDGRPARRILILGNSRTYYNDMPTMIRAMADSAKDPSLYEITVEALPGASFESLWSTPEAQTLLHERWDDAILQSESRAQGTEAFKTSFLTYGSKLIGAIHLTSGAPRLVVNWNYGAELFSGDDPDSGRVAYDRAIQDNTKLLGDRTGARLVNVGRLWSITRTDHPAIPLTSDGNHPTLAGSYLFALALYADLSHADVGRVTYVPSGLDTATAITLRQAVQDQQAIGS